jgi:hypothetical protein
VRLLLDEHYSPDIARQLRNLGHDVIAVAEESSLVGLSDEVQFATSPAQRRAIVTENVGDFRPLLDAAVRKGAVNYGLICVSPKRFPRSKREIGRMVRALDQFLGEHGGEEALRDQEHWLQEPA